MEKFSQLASTISLASISWDILIILFLFVISLFYGLLVGKNRIALTMLSTYVSFTIVLTFPFEYLGGVFGQSNIFLAKFAVFLLFIGMSFILLNRSFFGHLFKVSKALSNMSFPKIFLLSLAQVGLFMSIFFSYILVGSGNKLSGLSELIFTHNIAQVFWLIAPIVLLGIFKSKKPSSY